jgi:hypothetical protein
VRRLGVAVRWRLRRREYSWLTSTVSQLLTLADGIGLLLAVSAKALLAGKLSPRRRLALAEHGARVTASVGVLLFGERYVRTTDTFTRSLLNGGQLPPHAPPIEGGRELRSPQGNRQAGGPQGAGS